MSRSTVFPSGVLNGSQRVARKAAWLTWKPRGTSGQAVAYLWFLLSRFGLRASAQLAGASATGEFCRGSARIHWVSITAQHRSSVREEASSMRSEWMSNQPYHEACDLPNLVPNPTARPPISTAPSPLRYDSD